jgi:uncharacterized protein (TIGR00645 family)
VIEEGKFMSERRFEDAFERALFASRWFMAPFYVGLVIALILLLVVFAKALVLETGQLMGLDETHVLVWVLTLIDMSLAGNLLLMVTFAGYENFVSKLDVQGHPDRPAWMGRVDFSNMKLKLVASIIAISVIHLLKAFMSIGTTDKGELQWLLIIHGMFIVTGLFLALMDWLGDHAAENKRGHE